MYHYQEYIFFYLNVKKKIHFLTALINSIIIIIIIIIVIITIIIIDKIFVMHSIVPLIQLLIAREVIKSQVFD